MVNSIQWKHHLCFGGKKINLRALISPGTKKTKNQAVKKTQDVMILHKKKGIEFDTAHSDSIFQIIQYM